MAFELAIINPYFPSVHRQLYMSNHIPLFLIQMKLRTVGYMSDGVVTSFNEKLLCPPDLNHCIQLLEYCRKSGKLCRISELCLENSRIGSRGFRSTDQINVIMDNPLKSSTTIGSFIECLLKESFKSSEKQCCE